MNLAISNIGWSVENDKVIYKLMQEYGFIGLEIAPTRIFPEKPYDNIDNVREWANELKEKYGFCIPSIQSIWYGRQESIFGSGEERTLLLNYTIKAIDFAAAIECKNLVFGCPRNRNMPVGADDYKAVEFFRAIGDYAVEKGTVIGMEANPTIYNTNYINDTLSAIDLIGRVNSRGFLLNLDIGTMIQNGEDISELRNHVHLINHVHISEPLLKPVCERTLHKELLELLNENNYTGFISIEMSTTSDLYILEKTLKYTAGLS